MGYVVLGKILGSMLQKEVKEVWVLATWYVRAWGAYSRRLTFLATLDRGFCGTVRAVSSLGSLVPHYVVIIHRFVDPKEKERLKTFLPRTAVDHEHPSKGQCKLVQH